MNEKKICFVTCVNNNELYETCRSHIAELYVPEGITVEVMPIHGVKSMTKGYNLAIAESNAKYKVYLHQDTLIINKNLISDVINLFRSHPILGLLGVIGCTTLHTDGIWWNGDGRVGKVLEPTRLLEFSPINSLFQPVEAVDGLMMVTQYDVKWREDLFEGFHFYDLAQCQEFNRQGYLVGVPFQAQSWCKHGFGRRSEDNQYNYAESFEKNRLIFVNHYKDQ